MSEFYANKSFLDRKNFFTDYYSIISCISLRAFDVESVMNKLKSFSGFGIEVQVSNLKKCCDQLKDYKEDVRTEFYSLVNIVDTINSYESKAAGILDGSSEDFVISNPVDIFKTKKLTHTDLGKIVNQFKYYSQMSERHKRIYEKYLSFYNLGIDIEMSNDEYEALKSLFQYCTQFGYMYAGVSYFKTGYTETTDIDGEVKISAGSDSTKSKTSISQLSFDQKYTYDSLYIEMAWCDGEGNYCTETLQISGIDVKDSFNVNSLDISSTLKKIGNGNISVNEFNSIFSPLGIEASASTFAIKGTTTTIKKINDTISLYSKLEATIGEISAKASFDAGGIEAKTGYSIASVKSSVGIITNNGTYALNGKISAGQEYGITAKADESEASFGVFSIGFENEDGFDYYIWE